MTPDFLHFMQLGLWIDILLVLLFGGCFFALIILRSKKILIQNRAYNTELLAMRTEIYTEYEKNFFL